MQKKIFSLVLIFSLLVVFMFSTISYASGENWLEDWAYRKSLTFTGSGSAGINYQMMIVVDYSSGSDSGNTVYLDGACQTDFSDIRFTEDDGDTLLDYWLESKTDSDNAVFWIEVSDSLSSGESPLVYIYYGKSEVSSLSNGYNTFLFYDNFDGESLNTTNWDEVYSLGSLSFSDSILTVTGGTSTNKEVIASDNTFSSYTSLRFYGEYDGTYAVNAISSFGFQTIQNGGGSIYANYLEQDGTNGYFKTGNEVTYSHESVSIGYNSFHIYEIQRITTQTNFSEDGSAIDDGVGSYDASVNRYIQVTTRAERTFKMDWVIIRNCISSEPSYNSWGEQEELPTSNIYIRWQNNIGGSFYMNGTVLTNSSLISYANGTLFNLTVCVMNSSYSWVNFTFGSEYSDYYPYSLTLYENTTVWCYFGLGGESGEYIEENLYEYFLMGCVIVGLCSFILLIIKEKK